MVLPPALAEWLLFHPSRTDPGPPPDLMGIRGRDLTLTTADGVPLKAWWYAADGELGSSSSSSAVLLLHGNAGDISGRTPLAEGLLAEGLSVLLLEYRGYGGNVGKPSEEGLHEDALTGWRYLIEQTGDPGKIVVFGRSTGGAVAARLAATHPPGALVVESAFTSLADIGKSVHPFLPRFLLSRIESSFATREWVEKVRSPLLVIHGTEDELVPLRMGREVFEAGGGEKEWLAVVGAGHNDVYWVGGREYFRTIRRMVGGREGHRQPKEGGPRSR